VTKGERGLGGGGGAGALIPPKGADTPISSHNQEGVNILSIVKCLFKTESGMSISKGCKNATHSLAICSLFFSLSGLVSSPIFFGPGQIPTFHVVRIRDHAQCVALDAYSIILVGIGAKSVKHNSLPFVYR
jgi:hypothetical protein